MIYSVCPNNKGKKWYKNVLYRPFNQKHMKNYCILSNWISLKLHSSRQYW